MITIIQDDCRNALKGLADGLVQCVVTSPPYYGLRDYGTAQWDGGDPACAHAADNVRGDTGSGTHNGSSAGFHGGSNIGATRQFGHTCGRCGARRIDAQIGLEQSPTDYVAVLVEVFREVRRVLRDDGTLWLNLGDSYNAYNGNRGASKSLSASTNDEIPSLPSGAGLTVKTLANKQLLMIPARVALALQADGWWVRSKIIWHKPNPMPESVTDRPTSAYEEVFLLTKSARYYWDAEAVAEPLAESTVRIHSSDGVQRHVGQWKCEETGNGHSGLGNGLLRSGTRNIRNVWTLATAPFSEWTPSHALVPVPASEESALVASKSAVGRDMARITLPGCPLHVGQPDSVPKGFYDGLSADQVSDIRGTSDHRDLSTHPGSSTTQHIPVRSNSPLSNSDCSDLEGAASATPSNTENHRTDLDHLFSERAIACEETASDRLRTGPSLSARASIDQSTAQNRTAGDNSDGCEPETAAGTVHRSACRCGYYRKVTTKTSHFATFPPELAERCIKAGTSERGCCSKCGAPWVRNVSEREYPKHLANAVKAHGGIGNNLGGAAHQRWLDANPRSTTGWSASCRCDAATVPCTVLDPFAGAFTAPMVADRLGRNAVGIELSDTYCAMARARIEKDAGMFAEILTAPQNLTPISTQPADMGDLFVADTMPE